MDNPVLGTNHLIESMSDFNRQVVVEKELHAASACSKSTAASTHAGLISNHRATSLTESFARTLDDKIFVEIPSLNIMGSPKLRSASNATSWDFPRGHPRLGTRSPSNST